MSKRVADFFVSDRPEWLVILRAPLWPIFFVLLLFAEFTNPVAENGPYQTLDADGVIQDEWSGPTTLLGRIAHCAKGAWIAIYLRCS